MTTSELDGIAPARDARLVAAGGPLVQVRVVDGCAVAQAVTALEPRDIPVLGTFAEPWPVGRDQIIGEVAAELAATLSVQLYGPPGAGKKAIARAVIRRLAAGPNPVRGVELWPDGARPHTLGSVYERLAHLFFAGTTFQPREARLRAAAAAAGLAAVIVIGDCELSSQDLARLLGTFPDCTFLLTSGHRTLFSSGVAHEVGPLALDAAVELIALQTGQPAAALDRLQVAQANHLAAGQTRRLLQHAAFLQVTRGRSDLLTPSEQAATLAAGLSAPAASVLAALATFGTELAPDSFAAVTGLPARPDTGPAVAQAGAELEAAGLVTRTGAAEGGIAYRITPDALAAVTGLDWPPSSAMTAGRGLLQRLNWQDHGRPPPSPALLLAVTSALHAGGEDYQAARLIRSALPEVLAAGYVADWLRLLRLGLEAAGAAGATADLAYFTGEDETRRRLLGEKPAAGTGAGVPPTRVIAVPPASPRFAAGPPGPPPRRPGLARIVLAGHGIPVILIVVVLAVTGVLAVRSLTQAGRDPGPAAGIAAASAGASEAPAPSGAASASRPPRPAPSHRARSAPSHPKPSATRARPAPSHPKPSPSHSTARPSPSPPPTAPTAVVQAYFAAINARDYQKAWQLGGDNLTPSYAQFVAGFASTSSDSVAVGSTSGGVVGVLLTAVQTDGTTKFYSGTYTVTGGAITGSNIQQTG